MKVIFKFSFLRTVKKKTFLVPLISVILINILINIIIFSMAESFMVITSAMIFIILINMIYISYFNITNLTESFIQDHVSNIESLMLRKGRKPTTIFFSKILVNKLVSTIFILFVYLLYFVLSFISKKSFRPIASNNYSIGIFVLIAYDFFITWLVLLFSVTTKSYKKTLPFSWMFSILFILSPILGPGTFIMFGVIDISDNNAIKNLSTYDIYKERNKNNSLVNKIYDDYFNSQKLINEYSKVINLIDVSIINQENSTTNQEYVKKFIIKMFTSSFLIPELYRINNSKDNSNDLSSFIKNYFESSNGIFKISLVIPDDFNKQIKSIQDKDLFAKSLYMISPTISPEANTKDYFDNSLFKNNHLSSLEYDNGIKSLFKKDHLGIIEPNTNDSEINSLYKIIYNVFKYSYAIEDYSTPQIYQNISDEKIHNQVKFENNFNYLNKNLTIPYNYLGLFDILNNVLDDSSFDKPGYSEYFMNSLLNYKTIELNYILNPFNHFFIMSNTFNSTNNYYNSFIQTSLFLRGPIANVVYQNNYMDTFLNPNIKPTYDIYSTKFYIEGIYAFWLSTSILLIALSYVLFINRIYKKSGDK